MSRPTNLDGIYHQVRSTCPNAPVAWFLMASLAYYWADTPIISDACFDGICQDLLSRWDEIEHQHKHLIDPEALRAGTGYYLEPSLYPWMIRAATRRLLEGDPFHSGLPAWLDAPIPLRPDDFAPAERRTRAAEAASPPPVPAPVPETPWLHHSPAAPATKPEQLGLF